MDGRVSEDLKRTARAENGSKYTYTVVTKIKKSRKQNMVAFSNITLLITHLNRNAHQALAQPVTALKVRAGNVTYSPIVSIKSDVERRLREPSSSMTIAPLIRAFRAQLALTAPELVLRKWSMFCAFEGTRIGGCGRRSIPMFQIRLPSEITSATPQMTPAPTHEYDRDTLNELTGTNTGGCNERKPNVFSKSQEILDADVPETLESLLAPFMKQSEQELFTWSARFSFVVGEDEEEERRRREDIKTAAVTFSANKGVNAEPEYEFTAMDELVLEGRLGNYPPSMREQMRDFVRLQIVEEKKQSRGFGAPLPPSSSGGLFGSGGFGYDSGAGGGLFGQPNSSVKTQGLFNFGTGGASSLFTSTQKHQAGGSTATPSFGHAKTGQKRALSGLFGNVQPAAQTGGWTFGAQPQHPTNAFSFSPSTNLGSGNLNF